MELCDLKHFLTKNKIFWRILQILPFCTKISQIFCIIPKILQIFSPIVLIMVCAGNVIALTKWSNIYSINLVAGGQQKLFCVKQWCKATQKVFIFCQSRSLISTTKPIWFHVFPIIKITHSKRSQLVHRSRLLRLIWFLKNFINTQKNWNKCAQWCHFWNPIKLSVISKIASEGSQRPIWCHILHWMAIYEKFLRKIRIIQKPNFKNGNPKILKEMAY